MCVHVCVRVVYTPLVEKSEVTTSLELLQGFNDYLKVRQIEQQVENRCNDCILGNNRSLYQTTRCTFSARVCQRLEMRLHTCMGAYL